MVIHSRHSRHLGSEIDGFVYSNFFVILVSRLRNYRDVFRYGCDYVRMAKDAQKLVNTKKTWRLLTI